MPGLVKPVDHYLIQLASATASEEKPDLFTSIGIDWKLLALQTIAFLLLLWFLKRYVYPSLVGMLDKHDARLNEAANAVKEAEARALKSQQETEKLLREARKEASAIMSTAKQEASQLATESDHKAKERAERMVHEARNQVLREVDAAKVALRNELVDLVAQATEKVTANVVDAKANEKIISRSLKDAK